jgi:hypothetical protein
MVVRVLFVVARDDPRDYLALAETFDKEQDVQVVYDRRQLPSSTLPEPERRRHRPEVDRQIRAQGWAAVRVEPEVLP